MIGIYKIENKENHKCYIGKSKNVEKLIEHQKRLLKNKRHTIIQMQRDFNAHSNAFEFSIIESCEKEILEERKKYYIAKYDAINNGYNELFKRNDPFERTKESEKITLSKNMYSTLTSTLGYSSIILYLYLRFNSDKNNQIIINKSRVAEYFNVSQLTISNHINTLITGGILKQIGKEGVYCQYQVII